MNFITLINFDFFFVTEKTHSSQRYIINRKNITRGPKIDLNRILETDVVPKSKHVSVTESYMLVRTSGVNCSTFTKVLV